MLLVLVEVNTPADLESFAATGLPVYAHLFGTGHRLLLTGGNPAHLEALSGAGLGAIVLSADAADSALYLASAMPGRPEPDWHSYGTVLFFLEPQRLIMAEPYRAEALTLQGVKIQRISITPKPLYPAGEAGGFSTVAAPDPLVQAMIEQVTTPLVADLTGGLSGEWPVTIGGSPYTLATRYTYSGTPIQKATQYAAERLAGLGLDVELHQWAGPTYPNVIAELPGLVDPDRIFIIGAHLDDMPSGPLAPGADDNASGSAATLLAAEILSQFQWGCTLRFALWTGEEQGLLGSEAYAQRSYNDGEDIAGYLNLDMIAWNTGGSSPRIDLHANSAIPASLDLAQLFADVVALYGLDLIPEIVPNGSGASDHASFWQYGYTSILAIEDFGDFNPYYHTISDDMDNFQDWPYYTDFVKAALGTFAHMTGCLIADGLGQLDGTVTAQDGGAPLPDVEITIENPDGLLFTAATDQSGYYTRTLQADLYTVAASAFGYLPAIVEEVPVVTGTLTTQDFVLEKAPAYALTGTVVAAGTGAPLHAQVAALGVPVVPVWTDPATGWYELLLPAGAYSLQATAAGHHERTEDIVLVQNQTLDFALDPLACILLVDDDNNNPDVRPAYVAALDALGYSHDVFDVGGGAANGPDLAGLLGYRHVIWFSGDKFGGSAGPNGEDEAALSVFLEGGGNLFLSAQDYLYDFGLTAFGADYLGIASSTNDAGNASAKYGQAGDPIGSGLGPLPLVYPAGFTDYGDIVNPQAGASVAFRSSASGGSNLDIDRDGGAWRTVFFGTSWVPIYTASAANGEAVLERVIDWFGGCEPPTQSWRAFLPLIAYGPQIPDW